MERYAIFLELYIRLDTEYNNKAVKNTMAKLIEEIADHEEEFLGRERCLRCVDSAMRREVLENIKIAKIGGEEVGPTVFKLIYPRVVDKLGEMLGNYQNILLEGEQAKEMNKSDVNHGEDEE